MEPDVKSNDSTPSMSKAGKATNEVLSDVVIDRAFSLNGTQ